MCEGGRGVWYLRADAAASPGPSGASCRAWVVVLCAAPSGVSGWPWDESVGRWLGVDGGVVALLRVGGLGPVWSDAAAPCPTNAREMVGVMACGAEPLPG